jgi:hypothetical protein
MTPADVEHQAEAYRALRDRGGVSFVQWCMTKGFCSKDVGRIKKQVEKQDKLEREGIPF